MKSSFKCLLACIFAVVFSVSCINIDSIINLNRDGSGTMEVTMLMTRESADSLNQMQEKFTGSNTEPKKLKKNPFGKDDFVKKKGSYGSEINFESYDAVSNEKYIGGKAVFSFKNIEKLNMSPFPQANQKENPKDNMVFKFQNLGEFSKLTIIRPTDQAGVHSSTEKKKLSDDEKKQQTQMMKGFLKDMAISMKIKVNGKILKTDAEHVQDNKITLISVDFNNILSDSNLITKLNENPNDKNSLSKFNGVKGIVFETKPQIDVEFK